MMGHRDINLHFPVRKGFCGKAFFDGRQIVHFERVCDTKETYRWTNEERLRVAHIIAVATVPILSKIKTVRGHIEYKHIGVLNVDATEETGAAALARQDVQEKILSLAESLQTVIA
jgi:hypothetical protein